LWVFPTPPPPPPPLICARTHTHIHTHTYLLTHTYTHIPTHAHTHAHTRAHTRALDFVHAKAIHVFLSVARALAKRNPHALKNHSKFSPIFPPTIRVNAQATARRWVAEHAKESAVLSSASSRNSEAGPAAPDASVPFGGASGSTMVTATEEVEDADGSSVAAMPEEAPRENIELVKASYESNAHIAVSMGVTTLDPAVGGGASRLCDINVNAAAGSAKPKGLSLSKRKAPTLIAESSHDAVAGRADGTAAIKQRRVDGAT
jgi:hypothetical protein